MGMVYRMTKEERRIENKRLCFEQKMMQRHIRHRVRIRKLEEMINKMYDAHLLVGRSEELYSGLSKIVKNLDKRTKEIEN